MDFVEHLGERAFVSRMKRLVERMHQDNAQIFRDERIPFEPRWFLLLSLLDAHPALSVMEIAAQLRVTHPTVNQWIKEISQGGFVRSQQDPEDRRRRSLTLTPEGQALLSSLRPLWEDMTAAAREVIAESGYDVIAVLACIERVLDTQSYYQRMRRRIDERRWEAIQVLPYTPEDIVAVTALLQSLVCAEDALSMLDLLTESGTLTFLACDQDMVVGVAVLSVQDRKTYRYRFAGVRPDHQHQRVGQKLVTDVNSRLQAQGVETVQVLLPQQQMSAITFFRKLGFTARPNPLDAETLTLEKRLAP